MRALSGRSRGLDRRAFVAGCAAGLIGGIPGVAHAGSTRGLIRRDRLVQALLALPDRPEGVLLTDEYGAARLNLPALVEQVTATPSRVDLADVLTLDAINEEPLYDWTIRAALVAAAAKVALGHHAVTRLEFGDFVVPPNTRVVVPGTLEVTGRIVLNEGSSLVVAGDVVASDVVETDGHTLDAYYGNIAVGGDLRLGGVCSAGGMCIVAGRLTAPLVLAYYNQGWLQVANGIHAEIVYENDHGGSEVWGDSRVGVVLRDELRGLEANDGIEALRARINPALQDKMPLEAGHELEAFLRDHALAHDLLAP